MMESRIDCFCLCATYPITMNFALFLLSSYGITFTLCSSKVLEKPRALLQRFVFFRELLSCSFCTGFWSGCLSLLLLEPVNSVALYVCYGLAAAAFCYSLDTLIAWFESKTE